MSTLKPSTDAVPTVDDPMRRALQLHRQGLHAEVLASVAELAAAGRASADMFNLAGVSAKRLGQRAEAENCYRRVLGIDAAHTAALNNLAILLQESGRVEEAAAMYGEAISLAPADALPWLNLGNLHLAAKRFAEAEAAYQAALERAPEMPEAMRSMAEVYLGQNRRGEGEQCLRRALALRPNYLDALLRLGDSCREDKRLLEAFDCYQQVVALPGVEAAHLNRLGEVLQELKRRREAEGVYRKALALTPENPDVLNNLGILLHEQKMYAESESAYRQALLARPNYAEAHNNLAVLVQKLKRFDEAENHYQQALSLNPDYAAARCNYGLLCLTQGRFSEGWPMYEARYAPDRTVAWPKLSKPQWQGESLVGKGILIWNEQGLGDEIQFVRYAKILKAQGASKVGLVCKKQLTDLLSGLAGVDELHEEERRFSIKPYDYWTFPLSIPRYLCPTPADIPATPAYLFPNPVRVAEWASRLAQGRKVGLVWKGRPEYSNDANRSLPDLSVLAPLWSLPGVSFYSLQKGEMSSDASAHPDQPLIDLGPGLRDFADTAAVVSQLDLVICVDTAIAHLCGALGVKCWVMLPYVGTDWRWQLGRTDSPWYPSLRLFRQMGPDAWPGVVAEIEKALRLEWCTPADSPSDELWSRMRRLPTADRALVADLISRLARRGEHLE